jgi:hypothetical protein
MNKDMGHKKKMGTFKTEIKTMKKMEVAMI